MRTFIFTAFLLVFLATGTLMRATTATTQVGSQIEITEVKNLGTSAANDSKSIIQVSWTTQAAPDAKIQYFDLQLIVTYADGATEPATAKTSGSVRTNRFELSTLHTTTGRPAAEMKTVKVVITAGYTETATRLVSL